jgi:protein-S-isoprenylcysteine O-methyltransferase Ste14
VQKLDWSHVDYGILLLLILLCLYLYFLPSLLAFQRGHRRFWPILGLNILLAPVQSTLLQLLSPIPMSGLSMAEGLWASFCYLMGPGWLALLWWALRPVASPDARLLAFRQTKLADMLAGLPLVIWFAFSAIALRPNLVRDGALIASGMADLLTWLRFFALLFSILFCLLTVWTLLARGTAVKRIGGVAPRLCAVAGTFLGVGILRLPVPQLGLPMQALCALLIGLGNLAAFVALWKLGRSFSIIPEARRLVTTGAYAWARHPLYAAEIVIVLGLSLQYQQPWAALMGAAVIALQVTRSVFEERVLTEAFPEYADYRKRVKRFGIV